MSDEIFEILSRAPIAIKDDTTPESIEGELSDRLSALLEAHKCEPTAEGWRELALELAMQHEPAFRIETPVERYGRSGLGGAPVGWSGFTIKSAMKAEVRKGATQKEAAARVGARLGIAPKTAQNAMSGPSRVPDDVRRWKYIWVLHDAIRAVADKLSR